jgi:predicted MFS family arabinose efflux permease
VRIWIAKPHPLGLGGAGRWGIVLSVFGAGAATGGLALMIRKPQRPLLIATIATFTWTAPCIAVALAAPIQLVAAGAFIAGISSALFNTLVITTIQRRVPPDSLARVMSYVTFGAYSVGPIGLAIAGPIAEATSIAVVLATGVTCQLIVNTIVIAIPSVRTLRT